MKKYTKTRPPFQEEVDGVTPEVAQAVIDRAGGKCEQCDRIIPGHMQISHSIPRGMGGTHGEQSLFIHGVDNLRYLCEICHLQLFHHQNVRLLIGGKEISCATCPINYRCIEQAMVRGIIPG